MIRLQPARLPRTLRFIVLLTALLLTQSVVFAQTDQGRIVGTVANANGAFVLGATVTVRNDRTGEERTATTGGDGTFAVPALKASNYTVTATGKDFAPSKVTDVQLSVGQELALNITLKTSEVTASVDVVSASEAAIATGNASMGANVNQREIEGLPINGRQLSQLYLQAQIQHRPDAQRAVHLRAQHRQHRRIKRSKDAGDQL